MVVASVAVTTLLLLGVFVMHGMNGAHRWIRVAEQLQPSELAKPVIVLFLAFLQTRIHKMDDWKGTILARYAPAGVHRADPEGT